jgi:hypothetical protein
MKINHDGVTGLLFGLPISFADEKAKCLGRSLSVIHRDPFWKVASLVESRLLLT